MSPYSDFLYVFLISLFYFNFVNSFVKFLIDHIFWRLSFISLFFVFIIFISILFILDRLFLGILILGLLCLRRMFRGLAIFYGCPAMRTVC